jgi:hypothetical protein
MFERFWQRLRNQTSDKLDGNDERRAHPRHMTNMPTTCRVVNGVNRLIDVQVRNVSRGGINLLTEHELDPGTLLRVDLPQGSEEEAAILACVMHCNMTPEGKFSIGCSFSDELGDSELQEFGGRRQPTQGSDKRAWMRFPAHGFAQYVVLPPTGEPARKAEIANISPTGIGLLVDEKVEPGVILDLLLKTKGGEQSFDILACVVFLGHRAEGGWVLGCHFIRELEDADLDRLV